MVDTIKNTEPSDKHHQGFIVTEHDLKSIRESKGLTLRDIFERTRISVATLAAIENGEFHLLPPPVFTKSFIKVYAKSLGIDSNSILARYEQYLESLKPAHREAKIKEIPKSARLFFKASLWGLLILVIVGLVTFSLSTYETAIDVMKNQISEQGHKSFSLKTTDDIGKIPKSEAQDQTNVAAKTQEGDAQPNSRSQAQPPLHETEQKQNVKQDTAPQEINKSRKDIAGTYQVTMEAKELTWLRVTADQNPPYEILLHPGEKIEREASRFIIDVGNAGGIDITFQGNSLGNLGKHGQVVHLKLP